MPKLQPAALLATELREVKSKVTGKTYQISIALPYAYTQDPVDFDLFDKSLTAWPVVYVLDANWWFGLATDVYRFGAQLGSRQHAGFSLTRQVFSDKNHGEIVAPAFQAGLKMALAK